LLKIMVHAEETGFGRAFAHGRTVFLVCATMVGVCLTASALIRVVEASGTLRAVSRFLIAADALVFLVGAVVSFLNSRALVHGRRTSLLFVADAATFLGLVGTVVVCCTLVLTMV
jgi:hypothetical protein